MPTSSLGGGKWQAAKRHTLDANGLWQAAMWHTLGADELQQAAMRHTLGDDGLQQAAKQHQKTNKYLFTGICKNNSYYVVRLAKSFEHINLNY